MSQLPRSTRVQSAQIRKRGRLFKRLAFTLLYTTAACTAERPQTETPPPLTVIPSRDTAASRLRAAATRWMYAAGYATMDQYLTTAAGQRTYWPRGWIGTGVDAGDYLMTSQWATDREGGFQAVIASREGRPAKGSGTLMQVFSAQH